MLIHLLPQELTEERERQRERVREVRMSEGEMRCLVQ
jgi:hypothetical protein